MKELHSGRAGPFHVVFVSGFWGDDREKAEEALADYKSGEESREISIVITGRNLTHRSAVAHILRG